MDGTLPLRNLRVLDFTRVLVGPFATMILGDLGAEVIKVEPPEGDETRTWPPTLPRGGSGYFMSLNRNKKSITINLKSPQGQEIVRALARQVDVVVENFTPGVAAKMGIDYETLHRLNAGLIYCSISGFGQYGPYRAKKAYDPIIQGMTGLMSITGEKDRPPVKVGVPITDLITGLYAVIAIQAAHCHRSATGQGQHIDLALYDATLSTLTIMAMEYFATGKSPGRWGLDHIHRVPARAFVARDGKWVQVLATNDTMYPKFCRILGLESLAGDPRYDTNVKRLQHRDTLMPLFEARMRERDSEEWLRLFEEAGLPCGPILDLEEAFADPHVQAREMVFHMEHATEGRVVQLGFPYKFSRTPAQARLAPPLLGEHTEAVLKELLQYDEAEIGRLRQLLVLG